MLWHGNISFRQYIPLKRHRFGLKLFAIWDCKTSFVQDIVLYTEDGTEVTEDRSLGLSGAVVMTLMEPYFDKNHVLYVDNWYTSPALFEFLCSRQTGGCGTVTKRRKHMPYFPPLANKEDCTYRKAKGTLAVMWKDKWEVTFLTTVHHPQMVLRHNIDRSTRQRIMKPECVLDYNTNMRLVDKADCMISSIECARKTLKWYKKLYFHLVDITMLNAHILFKEKTCNIPTLQDIVIKVVRQLLLLLSTLLQDVMFLTILHASQDGIFHAPCNQGQTWERKKKCRKPAMFAVTQKDDQENGATLDIAVMSVM